MHGPSTIVTTPVTDHCSIAIPEVTSVGDNSDFLENAVFWGPKTRYTAVCMGFGIILGSKNGNN